MYELKKYKFGKKNETQSGRQVYTQCPRITSYYIAASSLVHTVGVGSKTTVLGMPAVQSKATGAILAHPFFSFPYSSPSPSSPSILRCHFKRNMLAKSLTPYLIPGFASFAISGVIQVFRMVLPRECPRQNFSNDQHLQLDCIIIGSHNSNLGTVVLKHFVPD